MKNEKCFFSIILPIYNVEKYLVRCIDSILVQNFKDYEIILVDDESPDNCPKICDEYCNKYNNIRVIHKKNQGLGLARNSGLDVALGKYVWFVDSDDFIENDSLKIIYDYICNNGELDVIAFGCKSINKDYNILNNMPPKNSKCYIGNSKIINSLLADFIYDENHYNYGMSACTKVFNKSFLNNNSLRFESEREWISEDYYFMIQLFNKINSIGFIEKSLYYYFKNGNSLTTKYDSKRFDKNLKFFKKMDELIIFYGYSDECKKRIKARFISNLMACLKQEIANHKNVGFKESYKKFKKICEHEYVCESVQLYKAKTKKWRIFAKYIRNKKTLKLYLIFYIKNIKEMKKYA